MIRFILSFILLTIACSLAVAETTRIIPNLNVGDTLVYKIRSHLDVEMEGMMGGTNAQTLDIAYILQVVVLEKFDEDSLVVQGTFSNFELPEEIAMLMQDSSSNAISIQYGVTSTDVQILDTVAQNSLLARMLQSAQILQEFIFPVIPANLKEEKKIVENAAEQLDMQIIAGEQKVLGGSIEWSAEPANDTLIIQSKADELQVEGSTKQQGMTVLYSGIVQFEKTLYVQNPENLVSRFQMKTTADMDMSVEGQQQMVMTVLTVVDMEGKLEKIGRKI